MKTPAEHFDYGIYIDHIKAFIISLNEFDRTQPALVRIELNPDGETEQDDPSKEGRSAQLAGMEEFSEKVVALLESPHRVVIFGPSEEKYVLHKEIQSIEGYDQVMKELIVSEPIEQATEAQAFAEKYFLNREPF